MKMAAEKKVTSQILKDVKPTEASFKTLIHLSRRYPSPVKRADLPAALNIRPKTVEKALEKLKQKGLVSSQRRGYYTSTVSFEEIFASYMDLIRRLEREKK